MSEWASETYVDPSEQIANLADAVKSLHEASNTLAHHEATNLLRVIARIREQYWPSATVTAPDAGAGAK